MSEPSTGLAGRGAALPLLAVGAWTALRLLIAARLGLSADEAYYWCWSEALDWGYYDHPPLIAWLIGGGTALLGDTELGVRGLGLLLEGALVGLLVATARDPRLLALLLLGAPLLALGGVIASPDVPLLCAWGLGLWAAERRRWGLAGLACGLALLAKLTGWLLWPCLWLGADKRDRGVYVAGALALLVAAPNLLWNARNGWIAYGFQLDHGLVADGGEIPGLVGLATFLGGQALIATPILAIALIGWWRQGRGERLLWWSSALPLAAFSVAAIVGHSEMNWAAPAWLAGLWGLSRAAGRLRRAAIAGGWVAAVLTGLVMIHALYPLWRLPRDPLDQLRAGEVLGPAVEAWGVEPVLTSRYQEAAWIRFYGGVDATTVPGIGRSDQFDLWPRTLPEETVFVRPARRSDRLGTDGLYRGHGGAADVTLGARGRPAMAWQVFKVSGLLDEGEP